MNNKHVVIYTIACPRCNGRRKTGWLWWARICRLCRGTGTMTAARIVADAVGGKWG